MRTCIYLFLCYISISSGNFIAQNLNKNILDSLSRHSERTNSNALLIYQNGKPIIKNYFGKPVEKIEAMSATKSIVSLAIGILLDKKFIDSLDQPVYTIYPEWKQGNKKLITIRHLLVHTSGMQNVPNAGEEIEIAPDVIQLALCAELEDLPGAKYSYNNKSSNLLAGIVEKTSKLKLDKFLSKYLFKDLGITDYKWRTDLTGNPYGMAGLLIYPEDLAKIGMFVLKNGKWNNKQLLSEKWIKEMLTPSVHHQNFGYEWWLTYDSRFIAVDDPFLYSVKDKTDESTFLLLQKLKGNYTKMKDIGTKAREIYTPEELKIVGAFMKNLPPSSWRIENRGSIRNYAASGYLGQYLILIPEKDLVIVRMISAENYKKIPKNDTFENLRNLVNEL